MSSQAVYDWLLNEEDSDDDDRRFYCSYLIGHASLVMAGEDEPNFVQHMELQLAETLPEDQLSERDKQGIEALWQQAKGQFASA